MSKYTSQQKHKYCIKYSEDKTTHLFIKKKDKKITRVTEVSNTFKENAIREKNSEQFFSYDSFHL